MEALEKNRIFLSVLKLKIIYEKFQACPSHIERISQNLETPGI